MNQELFLLKMGEIVLKGLNRRRFEERLMGNLQRRLHPYGRFRAISRQSIVYVDRWRRPAIWTAHGSP